MASRAGLDRGMVVQAAAALADATGGREVSLSDLAAHLRVRTPSLYNHVAGQEAGLAGRHQHLGGGQRRV